MLGSVKIYKLPPHRHFSRGLNLQLEGTKIRVFLALSLLFRAQTLDVDSAVCRCTTISKFGKPFVVLWNSPTGGCHVNFSVHIELEKYGIWTNSNQTWDGEVVTVFYNAQLGLYPFYRNEDKKMKVNDGLPQLVNLTEHLKKVSQHIDEKIPERRYSGLAVIDWEGWRPIWATNFGTKRLYQTESIALVKKEGKLKKTSEIEAEAKKRFERSGKRLIIETIELAKKLRPRALWGFYGLPVCYGNITTGYHCTKKNKKWNNKLRWLYRRSTALFPSIYLMEEHTENGKFVAARLTEAFRVSRMVASPVYGHELPVFPYLRPLYHYGARQFKMLNEDDLSNAIGQTVDYGSAGLILWGNHYDERTSRAICLKYNSYVNNKLGPYISLLREEVETCSRQKCSSNGRCVEKSSAVATELHGDGKRCKSIVKYGSVFKMENETSELQTPRWTTIPNTTADNRSTIPHKPSNDTEMEHHIEKLLAKNITAKHVTLKENKTSSHEKGHIHATTLNSTINKTKLKLTKGSRGKLKMSSKHVLEEIFDSSPNKTKTKEPSEPVWNKNAILGFSKKRKIDYIRIEKMAKHKNKGDVWRNKSESERLEMLNEKGINGIQTFLTETGVKRSDTVINTTRSHRHNHQTPKQKQKRGYSARAAEETVVKVPGVYIILITVTLGGALLMTIIYVAIYYTVNVRGRSHDHSYEYEYEEENPFSVEPNSPWWNDDADPAEKLLKSKKGRK